MSTAFTFPMPRGIALMLGWRRVLVALVASTLVGLILSPSFTTTSTARVIGREMFVGLSALLAFGIFEQWPARLPSWIARWALQVLAVPFAVGLALLELYLWINPHPPLWADERSRSRFMSITLSALLIAPSVTAVRLLLQRRFA